MIYIYIIIHTYINICLYKDLHSTTDRHNYIQQYAYWYSMNINPEEVEYMGSDALQKVADYKELGEILASALIGARDELEQAVQEMQDLGFQSYPIARKTFASTKTGTIFYPLQSCNRVPSIFARVGCLQIFYIFLPVSI